MSPHPDGPPPDPPSADAGVQDGNTNPGTHGNVATEASMTRWVAGVDAMSAAS